MKRRASGSPFCATSNLRDTNFPPLGVCQDRSNLCLKGSELSTSCITIILDYSPEGGNQRLIRSIFIHKIGIFAKKLCYYKCNCELSR
jgi:hypothetical protein